MAQGWQRVEGELGQSPITISRTRHAHGPRVCCVCADVCVCFWLPTIPTSYFWAVCVFRHKINPQNQSRGRVPARLVRVHEEAHKQLAPHRLCLCPSPASARALFFRSASRSRSLRSSSSISRACRWGRKGATRQPGVACQRRGAKRWTGRKLCEHEGCSGRTGNQPVDRARTVDHAPKARS